MWLAALPSMPACSCAGAGKTYTMSGGKQSFRQRGIIPRIIGQLFTELKNMQVRTPALAGSGRPGQQAPCPCWWGPICIQ